jgi:prepilin-type N-terminal cleavage/methylation domain-containing protein
MMRRGFSLVELSIVLVILGLLTGGILAGQSLIRAAELRSVVTEYQRYTTAVQSFRDKYLALPGDMTNAERFWGTAHATDATCITTSSGSVTTCNGDGDGQVEAVTTRSNETFRFWQHLANAGLIEGSYTGVAGPLSYLDALSATNVPSGRLTNAVWTSTFVGNAGSANASYYEGEYKNIFQLGGILPPLQEMLTYLSCARKRCGASTQKSMMENRAMASSFPAKIGLYACQQPATQQQNIC